MQLSAPETKRIHPQRPPSRLRGPHPRSERAVCSVLLQRGHKFASVSEMTPNTTVYPLRIPHRGRHAAPQQHTHTHPAHHYPNPTTVTVLSSSPTFKNIFQHLDKDTSMIHAFLHQRHLTWAMARETDFTARGRRRKVTGQGRDKNIGVGVGVGSS